MAIFNNDLAVTMKHRLTWLNARSSVISDNIARADIKGEYRKDIKPFQKIVKENSQKSASSDRIADSTNTFAITPDDVHETRSEIEREIEVLEMNHNVTEQDALVSLVKNFHSLYKLVIAKH